MTIGKRMWIQPHPERRVIDPKSRAPLPPEGRFRRVDQYWLRRERDGDVTISADRPKPATLIEVEPPPIQVSGKKKRDFTKDSD